MIFETERLIIREVQEGDFNPFHALQSNPNVMRYVGRDTKTKEEDRLWFDKIIACYRKPDNDFWIWSIVRKSDQTMIGTCAIVSHESHEHTEEYEGKDEIGYRFIEEYWGNGYGNEVTEGLINYAFTKFGKTELMAEVDELNKASVKILEKHMNFIKTYYNAEDKSNDRLYSVKK